MKKIAVLLIIVMAFLCACNSNKWQRKTVVKQRDFIVTLEQHQVDGKIVYKKYNHPIQLDPADLKRLMQDLTYIEEAGFIGEAKENPVFQAVEIDRLAPALADALANADDSQRIRFSSSNQGKAFIFSVSRETEGVLFIEPGAHLNIAFCGINSEIDPTDTNAYPPDFSRIEPLRIKASGTTIVPTAPYARLHEYENAKSAPMWLIADLEKLKESINKSVSTIEVKEEAPPTNVAPAPSTDPVVPVISPEPVIQKTEAKKTMPVQTPESAIQKDIKNKLKYLKELLDEGLISEKDYNAKKEELLDKIN
jgi:hypothetical protein